jgi:hypothetical protein
MRMLEGGIVCRTIDQTEKVRLTRNLQVRGSDHSPVHTKVYLTGEKTSLPHVRRTNSKPFSFRARRSLGPYPARAEAILGITGT